MGTKRRYRVLRGKHWEGMRNPNLAQGQKPQKCYYRGSPDGDIVETEADLLKLNVLPNLPKFQLVGPEAKPTKTLPDLESMTVNQLRAYAEAEEIDLGGAKSRDDILRILQQGVPT